MTHSDSAAAAVLTSGVDWLTCTAATDTGRQQLLAAAWPLLYGEAEAGNDLRPWLWKGYVGYQSGAVAVGEREDGSYCRLSGLAAFAGWRHVAPWWSHVSRLDLQVTVRLSPGANPVRSAWDASMLAGPRRRGRQTQKRSHIETVTEGETCYIGSRSSDRFGRIYNKSLESGLEMYRDCWRWEVEFKGRAATPTASWLSEQHDTSLASAVAVRDAFSRWSAEPTWAAAGPLPPDPPERTRTDAARRLQWLATQVRPVVAQLRAMGYDRAVLVALGLTDDVT